MLKRTKCLTGGLLAAAASYGIFLGCHGAAATDSAAQAQTAAPAPAADHPATTAPAPASVVWDRSDRGVKLKYPGDWQPKKNPDYELMLLPPGGSGEARRITVDIPDLPPHFAFMIQMGRVQSGYVDDLKKEHPGAAVKDASDVNLPDCKAKLIQSTWRLNNATYEDVALLLIHDGNVYILDAQTDEDHLAATRAAFDSMESTLQWVKR